MFLINPFARIIDVVGTESIWLYLDFKVGTLLDLGMFKNLLFDDSIRYPMHLLV